MLCSLLGMFINSNISAAAKIACGIFQSGACHIQMILYLCLLMYIFSHTPGIKEEQEKESSVLTCKIQTATEDVPYAAVLEMIPLEGLPFPEIKQGFQTTCLLISSPATLKQQ